MSHHDVSEQQIKQAKHPHELFLINLVTNHILIFIALLGLTRSYPWLILIVPVISFSVLGYTILRARRSLRTDSWYVYCHWQLGAKRSRFFIIMMLIMVAVVGLVLLLSGGNPGPQHYALGGVGILPTLVTVLVLIVMESDAMHQASTGQVPKWLEQKYPNPDATPSPDTGSPEAP